MIIAIDFGPLTALSEADGLEFAISASRGSLTPGILQKNPGTGGMRLSFRFDPEDEEISEMRAQLLRDEKPVSEVWVYRWTA